MTGIFPEAAEVASTEKPVAGQLIRGRPLLACNQSHRWRPSNRSTPARFLRARSSFGDIRTSPTARTGPAHPRQCHARCERQVPRLHSWRDLRSTTPRHHATPCLAVLSRAAAHRRSAAAAVLGHHEVVSLFQALTKS
jgi:hypothetical protein